MPFTVLLYYICPNRIKNLLLLIVSLIFYAWGEPSHIILMIVTTFYIWLFGLLIDKCKQKNNLKCAKFLLVLSLILSLSTLAFYKYFGFITDNLPFLKDTALGTLRPSLPIGISFYTFQALSYSIDVYRGNAKVQTNWLNFAMYISFFPQLIAGPIVQYSDIESQLKKRTVSLQKFSDGISRFCVGLGKKVLLANQVGLIWNEISRNGTLSILGSWLGAIAFAFQIYFDFSAYSDMAIGLGKMFGFEFPENFQYPYQSKSVSEFWRRWHITLGTWFREYVYIPLGGNRKGKLRLLRNLLIVWSLTGLWHGAAWQFLLWGIYYFIFISLEKFIFNRYLEKVPSIFKYAYTGIVVLLGWVLFAAENISTAFQFYKAMFGIGASLINSSDLFILSTNAVLLIICAIGVTNLPKKCYLYFQRKCKSQALGYICNFASLSVLWLSVAFLMGNGYNPFLYFHF